MKELLKDLLKARITPEGWAWMEKAMAAAQPPVKSSLFLGNYTGASRRLGKKALTLNAEETARLEALQPGLPMDHWGCDEVGRAVLLLEAAPLPPAEFQALALECYTQGDSREQQSWLRAVGLLPGCEAHLDTVTDACRTNIMQIFEAVCCENPYPALYFPELHFNQMILKALFNQIALSRVIDLPRRLNADLSRMANDYVSEREAASRQVPHDIWLVIAPHADSSGLERVSRYLSHQDHEHRYWAAVGLGYAPVPEARQALQAHGATEKEPQVQAAIAEALARQA